MVNSQASVKSFAVSRSQLSILSRSLIVCGIAFFLICVFSYLIYKIFINILNPETISEQTEIPSYFSNLLVGLYIASIVLLIITMIMSMYLIKRVETCSIVSLVLMILFYGVAQGIAFGTLFYSIACSAAIDANSSCNLLDIAFIFAIGGGIFLLSGLIGTFLSHKATFTLGKLLSVMIAITIILMVVLVILGFILPTAYIDKFIDIFYIISGVMFVLFAAYDFSIIKKSEPFIKAKDANVQLKYTLMFGFMLLADLIGIIWTLLRIYLRFKR